MLQRLLKIENQAFAQNRIEEFVHKCSDFWFFHQIPDQDPVIQVYKERIGPVGAYQAF